MPLKTWWLKIIQLALFSSAVRTMPDTHGTGWMRAGVESRVKPHNMSCLIWRSALSLSAYHRTDEISSRKLLNRVCHLAIAENSSITAPGLSGGKNSIRRKPPLKMDLVQVEEKHIPKPGVHRGNNNSPNNNDHKLLSTAEWWQDFLKELAEHWCFKDRRVVCVLWF